MERFIEGLNRSIEDKRKELGVRTSGHVVLQQTIIPNAQFKIYKEFKSVLWFIKGRNKYVLLDHTEIIKAPEGQEEEIIKRVNIEFCQMVFNWIGSEFYNKVVRGESYEYTDEQVSNTAE